MICSPGMRRFAVLFAAACVFVSCAPQARIPVDTTVSDRVIVPQAGPGIALAAGVDATRVGSVLSEHPAPRVTFSEVVVDVMEANLDLDVIEEQVIIYKQREDPLDLIRLVVLDFDNVRDTYVISWRGATRATDRSTFSLSFLDITGDHDIELVAMGSNAVGDQSIDVFKRTPPPTGIGLYYRPIASVAAAGSIEIDEFERSGAYQNGLSWGRPYDIRVQSPDEDSNDIMDLIETTYSWLAREDRYVVAGRNAVPAASVGDEELNRLYRGDEDDFMDFLRGPWFRSSGNSSGTILLHFDPAEERITFLSDDIQEAFRWDNSSKTIYQNLQINLTNESIASVRRYGVVTVESLNSIRVSIHGSEMWDGTYRKLSADLQQALVGPSYRGISLSDLSLSGLFSGEAGMEVFFSQPFFTLRENDTERRGGFALFEYGGLVLQLKILDDAGRVVETRTYRAEFSEEEGQDRVIRRLVLRPATPTVSGVIADRGSPIRLEQIVERER